MSAEWKNVPLLAHFSIYSRRAIHKILLNMLDSSSNKWLQARALAICITWNYTFAFFHAYRPSCPFGPFIFRQSENHCTVSLSLTIERTLCTHIKSCNINTRSQRFRHSSILRSSKFWNLIFHFKKIIIIAVGCHCIFSFSAICVHISRQEESKPVFQDDRDYRLLIAIGNCVA